MGTNRSRQCSSENQQENRVNRWISNHTETGKFNTSGDEYRYGEYYLYTQKFKDKDHYVTPKYKNMDKEIIQNGIRLRVLNKTKKAVQGIRDRMIRSCMDNKINQKECFQKYGIRLYARKHKYYNERYNIKAGEQISLRHLVAVKLYFDKTAFPSALRRTYWSKEENETFEHIKSRHTEFAHTCRALCEAIYLFGETLPKQTCVYRGVSQITFAWFDAVFAGPVSTSIDPKVAQAFAGGGGSIIQLESAENTNMYINGGAKECNPNIGEYNLSNHAEEKEYLMWTPCLHISDVLYSLYKRQYVKSYVSAMLLFQKIITGYTLNQEEEKQLLNDNIQKTLNALIQWRITNNNDELIEFVNTEHIQTHEKHIVTKEKLLKPSTRSNNSRSSSTFFNTRSSKHSGNTSGCLNLISTKKKCTYILPQTELHEKTEFIKSLCGTVFENLFNRTQLFWDNIDIKLNANLKHSIEILLKGYQVLKCNALKWKVCVEDLESAPDINDHFLKIDEYLKKEIIDEKLLKTFLYCDKIMDCIREYFDIIYPIDFLSDWKCDVKYKNEMYSISPLLSLWPNCTRPNNKYYDIEIGIINTDNIKDLNSLQWSFDILCDELDISMHFVDRYVKDYPERQHTQIISNDDIRKLVNDRKDIVWHINIRFHHSN